MPTLGHAKEPQKVNLVAGIFNFDCSFLMMFCSCTTQTFKVNLMFQGWVQVTTCWCKNWCNKPRSPTNHQIISLMWLLGPRKQFLPSYPLQEVMDPGCTWYLDSGSNNVSVLDVVLLASFFAPIGVGLLYCCPISIHISRCTFRISYLSIKSFMVAPTPSTKFNTEGACHPARKTETSAGVLQRQRWMFLDAEDKRTASSQDTASLRKKRGRERCQQPAVTLAHSSRQVWDRKHS